MAATHAVRTTNCITDYQSSSSGHAKQVIITVGIFWQNRLVWTLPASNKPYWSSSSPHKKFQRN